MSKKQWITYISICLAIIAIIVGFYFVFLGNKIITEVPDSLQVEKIDDDYYLVTKYNANYGYQFKLEQFLDDDYVVIDVVDSDINTLNLNESKLDIIAGQSYRFSACYTTENGAGNSDFSETLIWQPSWALDSVDYQTVNYKADTETLSWGSVYLADSYVIKFVDDQGQVVERASLTNSVLVDDVEVGKYTVYIFGQSSNDYISQSYAGEGVEIAISRKNVINNVSRESGVLSVSSTEKVDVFEIYVDGALKGTLKVSDFSEDDNLYYYTFENSSFLFGQIDFEKSVVQIKSLASGYVLESDFVELS